MSRYEIKVTPYAKSQMQEIRDYIIFQLMNPDAAKNLLLEMQKRINDLEFMPESVKTIEEQPWGSQGIRKIIVKNFSIYFWIDEDNRTVHIVAVTYSKRNQKNVLGEIEI